MVEALRAAGPLRRRNHRGGIRSDRPGAEERGNVWTEKKEQHRNPQTDYHQEQHHWLRVHASSRHHTEELKTPTEHGKSSIGYSREPTKAPAKNKAESTLAEQHAPSIVGRMYDDDSGAPFWPSFGICLLFGIPVCVLSYVLSVGSGMLMGITTLGIGVSCGLGARKFSFGRNGIAAAICSTIFLWLAFFTVITAKFLAIEMQCSTLEAAIQIIREYGLIGYANFVLVCGGRALTTLPFALFGAYKAADNS